MLHDFSSKKNPTLPGFRLIGLVCSLLVGLLPVALFATLGFMLPAATPPNAIVFGGGELALNQMMKAGAMLDLVSALIVALVFLTLGKWIFGL